MMLGLDDMVSKGRFPRGSVVVAVHTGGLGFDGRPLLSEPGQSQSR
jgi:hypothetical protein